MLFRRKISILIVSLIFAFSFFDLSNASYIRKEEKEQIYVMNFKKKSEFIRQWLLNYIDIKRNLLENVDNEIDDDRIQKDIKDATSMSQNQESFPSDILYNRKNLIITDNDLKPVSTIIIDVANNNIEFKYKDEILNKDDLKTFYTQHKPDFIYKDNEAEKLWNEHQAEEVALAEARSNLLNLYREVMNTEPDISHLSKDEIDSKISSLMERKEEVAEEQERLERLQREARERREKEEREVEELKRRMKEERILAPFVAVMNYLNTQNPNGELRGPVIKGLQLGMSSDKAIPIFEKNFGEYKIFNVVQNNNFLGMTVENKDGNIKIYFDKNKNIVSMYYIENGISTAFGISNFGNNLEKFNKAYKLNLVLLGEKLSDLMNKKRTYKPFNDLYKPLMELGMFGEITSGSLDRFDKVKDNLGLHILGLASMISQSFDYYIDMDIKKGYIVKCFPVAGFNNICSFIGIYAIDKERQKTEPKPELTLD